MAEQDEKIIALSASSAHQLADVVKTVPQFDSIGPRWLTRFLDWKGLDSGIFRLNKVREGRTPLDILCSQEDNTGIPESFIDYDPKPREYVLNTISAIININTRVSDLYGNPYDQVKEQLRLAIESIKERQESQLLHNGDYGFLSNVAKSQRIKPRKGYPTPDDMDELISRVWKEPSFFLAHPAAMAAFGRECTRRGVPPATVNLHGSSFMTWRGIPIVPSDKLFVDGAKKPKGNGGKTTILLIRTGEAKQGAIGLYMAGLHNEQSRGLSVRYMGIDKNGVGAYLVSLYCSAAILTEDAIGALEDVDVGNYYEY